MNNNPDIIVGGSDEDFIAQAVALAQSCGQPGAQQQVAACSASGTGPRLTMLGSTVTSISTSTNTDVTITVRKGTFVGRRLVIPSGVASKLRVVDVKVGGVSILPSSDPIPGDAFNNLNPQGGYLPFIPAPVSQTIVITLLGSDTAAVSTLLAIEGVML